MMGQPFPDHHSGQVRAQPSNGTEGTPPPLDLRQMLADLGNRLVHEYGFRAADLQGCSTHLNRTTEPLVRFLVWLQHTPEACYLLRDMGWWPQNTTELMTGKVPRAGRAPR
jgi:hypothetical protein